MKYPLLLTSLLAFSTFAHAEVRDAKHINSAKPNVTVVCPSGTCTKQTIQDNSNTVITMQPVIQQKPSVTAPPLLTQNNNIHISVVGQGVAPLNTSSPAQAYALAKKAAIADAYRLIAEKVKGVRVDGEDLIKDMMIKKSTVRTAVMAMLRNTNIVNTTFKDGLCEVEMEITLLRSELPR